MNFSEKTMQKSAVVIGLAVLANFLWGSAASVIKTGYQLFHVASDDMMAQILFAGIRFFIAGILTVLLGSLINKKFLLPTIASWPKISVIALFQTVIQYVFVYMGCAHASGTNVAIASSTGTFFSILFSALLFHQERLTTRKILGCVLGFAGVVLINISAENGINFNMSFAGEGAIILSTCSFALANSFTKLFSKTENPVMLCGYQFILGGFAMIIVSLALGAKITFAGIPGVLLILYLSLVSAVAFSVTSLLMKYNPVSRVSIFGFLNPVFGVILSMLLLGESHREFGLRGILALVLVCAGVFVVNYSKTLTEKSSVSL